MEEFFSVNYLRFCGDDGRLKLHQMLQMFKVEVCSERIHCYVRLFFYEFPFGCDSEYFRFVKTCVDLFF